MSHEDETERQKHDLLETEDHMKTPSEKVAATIAGRPQLDDINPTPTIHERRGQAKRPMRGALIPALLVASLLTATVPVAAQPYYATAIDRRGFYLGLAGMGNFVLNQSNAPVNGFIDHGGGFGLFLGWRIVPMFALELAYTLNIHNPVQDANGATVNALLLHAGTLDGKIIFPNRSSVRPFLQLGLGLYELAMYNNGAHYRNGVGFQLGGGLDFWLNRTVAIGGRLLYHGIYFTQTIWDHRPFLSTLTAEINLQIHF